MAKHGRGDVGEGSPGLEELAGRFVDSMGVIMRMRGSVFRRAMGEHGVTGPQLFLMKMVGTHGEMSVTGVSEMMMVTAPTASRMIDGLCARGLLQRRKDPRNRRATYVSLTREGEKVMRRLWEMQKTEFLRLMRDEDRQGLAGTVLFLEDLAERLPRQLKGRGSGEQRRG